MQREFVLFRLSSNLVIEKYEIFLGSRKCWNKYSEFKFLNWTKRNF